MDHFIKDLKFYDLQLIHLNNNADMWENHAFSIFVGSEKGYDYFAYRFLCIDPVWAACIDY